MKGYLQRLMQTVTNPAESVHPWTGSLFATVHETEEFAPSPAASQSLEIMSPGSAQSSRESAPAETSLLAVAHNSVIPELQTQIASGSTKVERSVYRRPSVAEQEILEPLIDNTERSAPVADATEVEMTPAQGLETAAPPRGRRSLAGAEAVVKARNTRPLAVASSFPLKEKNDALSVGKQVAGDRQTDEIQIHIGRIEVTAIHPPAPTVPKARDKEISLDAYLKRRDGRAR